MKDEGDELPAGGAGAEGLTLWEDVERQAAAIAYLPESEPLRFVLVTTRRTRRWTLPKGGVEEGFNGPATAVREAWEEAGVLGPAEPAPIGAFRARKVRPPDVWPIEVEVFPVAVSEIRDRWPEAGERRRRFVTVEEARVLLGDPELVRIIEEFAAARR